MEAEEARVKALVAAKEKREQFLTVDNAKKLKNEVFMGDKRERKGVEMLKKAGFPGQVLIDADFPEDEIDLWYRPQSSIWD